MKVTRKRLAVGMVGLLVAMTASLVGLEPASAQGETFEVLSVDETGCASGEFAMTVERANLDGGSYTVHTIVTVDDLVYMNENATISVNGESGWNLFDNFTYGPVPNPGTWPIPMDQEMRIDFLLERPLGTILYEWTLIVDGCNTGAIIYNGPTGAIPPDTTTTQSTETTVTTSPSTSATPEPTAAPASSVRPRFTG
jgi:hypothetical protein